MEESIWCDSYSVVLLSLRGIRSEMTWVAEYIPCSRMLVTLRELVILHLKDLTTVYHTIAHILPSSWFPSDWEIRLP